MCNKIDCQEIIFKNIYFLLDKIYKVCFSIVGDSVYQRHSIKKQNLEGGNPGSTPSFRAIANTANGVPVCHSLFPVQLREIETILAKTCFMHNHYDPKIYGLEEE